MTEDRLWEISSPPTQSWCKNKKNQKQIVSKMQKKNHLPIPSDRILSHPLKKRNMYWLYNAFKCYALFLSFSFRSTTLDFSFWVFFFKFEFLAQNCCIWIRGLEYLVCNSWLWFWTDVFCRFVVSLVEYCFNASILLLLLLLFLLLLWLL